MDRKPQFFLREWRKYKGLTQKRLADRLEIEGATVSRIETGKQNYTRETLEAIADALGIEVADLFRDPNRPDYQLWRIINGLKPDAQQQALRVIEAMNPEKVPKAS